MSRMVEWIHLSVARCPSCNSTTLQDVNPASSQIQQLCRGIGVGGGGGHQLLKVIIKWKMGVVQWVREGDTTPPARSAEAFGSYIFEMQ